MPLRYRDIPRVFGLGGELAVDVAVIQCAPPQRGRINLGIACSIFPAIVAGAKLVVAEIHPDMPRTHGDTELPVDAIDVAVEAEGPLGTLARTEADAVDRAIVERVLGVLPEAPWVQLGVGAIPDAILGELHRVPGVRLHSGMFSDALAGFLDHAGGETEVVTGEIAGSLGTYRRAAGDRRVQLRPTEVTHGIPYLVGLERLVSINSAIEVDLMGQVNGETVGGRQISGVGGSLDFVEGARYSPGGRSIMAMRSMARDASRIVPRIRTGDVVSVPRFALDCVVTEHCVAHLRGLDLDARAEALIAVAAPEVRADLRRAVS